MTSGALPLTKNPLEVTIPGGEPTGQVFNSTMDFVVSAGGASGPSVFHLCLEIRLDHRLEPDCAATTLPQRRPISVSRLATVRLTPASRWPAAEDPIFSMLRTSKTARSTFSTPIFN